MIATQMIVLSKQPYRESALLLCGLSPDCGRLSLVAHGAQKISGRDFPEADLFRELNVEFEPSDKSDLQTVKHLELETAFDALADTPRSYKMAGKISEFLLKNVPPELPQPFTYDALRSVFSHLANPAEPGAWNPLQCAVVLKITYLYENGLLPETEDGRTNDFMENLVAAGVENTALPECQTEYWKTLNEWTGALLRR